MSQAQGRRDPVPLSKTYLGDSVYAEVNYGTQMIRLTTENGGPPSNEIFLGSNTVLSLLMFMKSKCPGINWRRYVGEP